MEAITSFILLIPGYPCFSFTPLTQQVQSIADRLGQEPASTTHRSPMMVHQMRLREQFTATCAVFVSCH